ncbi:diaminopimelate decarboxylase [Roseiterribacter gracilis]|uniref:Diaminopimelate decarboxylase n=1 Tax=Roseiterribacter gracilis TaxID=2812848 RepID=A0A8S8XBU9_9PROT|nr:diaminopimelate decarboxylase [Rhodospirillales bacterium TMPK1]
MTGFTYKNGVLHADDIALSTIADKVGTPTYVYASSTIEQNYARLANALSPLGVRIAYALKANSNQAVIATLARLGAGGDIVSGGELTRAMAAGIAPDRIVFSGVGKTADEVAQALRAGIHQFNVESIPELDLIDRVAASVGIRANVALRVNPDVDAGTHAKITTGRKDNKFGIDLDDAAAAWTRAVSLPNLNPVGLAVHIGSQLIDLTPYRAAYRRLADLVRALRAQGHEVSRLDLGGGLGVGYRGETGPDVADYAALVREMVSDLGCSLMVEPGRYLVAEAGCVLSRVLFVKDGSARRFVILDAGMNDLLRPALYDSFHAVVPVKQAAPDAVIHPADIVGPVCETGDTFAKARELPPLEQGDLVAFLHAGAYGAVMGSTYNTRPLAAEVLVAGNKFELVRPRQTVEDLLSRERIPSWLSGGDQHSPSESGQPLRSTG